LIFVIACLTNLLLLFPSAMLNDAKAKVVARRGVYQVSGAAIESQWRGNLVTARDSYGFDELAHDEITSQELRFASPCDFRVSFLICHKDDEDDAPDRPSDAEDEVEVSPKAGDKRKFDSIKATMLLMKSAALGGGKLGNNGVGAWINQMNNERGSRLQEVLRE
jgi:hypothetical protein